MAARSKGERRKAERHVSAKRDAREAEKEFTVIYHYNVTPLRYPNKSAGNQIETFVTRVKARSYVSAAKALRRIGLEPYLLLAIIEGWSGAYALNSYLVESMEDARRQFPAVTEPNYR